MKYRIFLPTFALLLLMACGKQESSVITETATSGTFQLVADEALKPAIDSLVTGFMIENPGAKVSVKYTSATEAVRELINHDARAIIIDRSLTPPEREILQKDSVTLPEYRLAEDGIACIVSARNTRTTIRKHDLESIFNGMKNDWDPVTLVFPGYPSSIEYGMDSILSNGSEPKSKFLVRLAHPIALHSTLRHTRRRLDSLDLLGYTGLRQAEIPD